MRLEKLGFNITPNPFLVALSILGMIFDLYLCNSLAYIWPGAQ